MQLSDCLEFLILNSLYFIVHYVTAKTIKSFLSPVCISVLHVKHVTCQQHRHVADSPAVLAGLFSWGEFSPPVGGRAQVTVSPNIITLTSHSLKTVKDFIQRVCSRMTCYL